MVLSGGNKVFYPCQGLCLIHAVIKLEVDDRSIPFYHLLVLDKGGDLFVPVDKVETVGIRWLLKKSEIPHLLEELKQPSQAADHYSQRAFDNAQRIVTGSAFDLVKIIVSLTRYREKRKLAITENKILEKAKRLLICEIAEVLQQTEAFAEKQVTEALNERIQD